MIKTKRGEHKLLLWVTWAPSTKVEGQSVRQFILTLYQPLCQLYMARLPGRQTQTQNKLSLLVVFTIFKNCFAFHLTILPQRIEFQVSKSNSFINEVCFHCLLPCVVHRSATVDVRCSGVRTVHHQQLSLQDLACFCCHMEWGSAFLLEGQGRHTNTVRGTQRVTEQCG